MNSRERHVIFVVVQAYMSTGHGQLGGTADWTTQARPCTAARCLPGGDPRSHPRRDTLLMRACMQVQGRLTAKVPYTNQGLHQVLVRPQASRLFRICGCSAARQHAANRPTQHSYSTRQQGCIEAVVSLAAAVLLLAHPGPVRADPSTDSTSTGTGIVAAESSVLEEQNDAALRASKNTPKVCSLGCVVLNPCLGRFSRLLPCYVPQGKAWQHVVIAARDLTVNVLRTQVASQVFLEVKSTEAPGPKNNVQINGRIKIQLFDDVPVGAQRFALLAKGNQGVGYQRSQIDGIAKVCFTGSCNFRVPNTVSDAIVNPQSCTCTWHHHGLSCRGL